MQYVARHFKLKASLVSTCVGVRHDNDTCDDILLFHFCKLLGLSTCQCCDLRLVSVLHRMEHATWLLFQSFVFQIGSVLPTY